MSRFRSPRRPWNGWGSGTPENAETTRPGRIDRFDPTRRTRRPREDAKLPTVEEISAGGMVVRERSGRLQVAIIARYNRGGRLEWVLPKGHPEGEEDHHAAAEREVAEETGISGTVLTALGSIDYWFTVPGHRVHKTVHHFLLRATGGTLTIDNDPDQEAIDVAWVDLERLSARLTFVNERRIVEAAQDTLPEFFTHVPVTFRSRRVIPLRHRLPSGLIPENLRPQTSAPDSTPESSNTTQNPGTPGENHPATHRESVGSFQQTEDRPSATSTGQPGQDATTRPTSPPTPFELMLRVQRFRHPSGSSQPPKNPPQEDQR
ncbi:hypothetical protein DCC24_05410 [Auritidibacter sp. NML100628]|nr:hypothetical protein DCC24_05410 [Auritidibacter sp. NML100628]